MASNTSFWLTVISSIGLSGIVSTALTLWITSRREHRRWILDNKKVEWRELIDAVHSYLSLITDENNRRALLLEVDEQVKISKRNLVFHVNQLIDDRIFIREEIDKAKIMELWRGLIMTPTDSGFTPERVAKEETLKLKLQETARKDLHLNNPA